MPDVRVVHSDGTVGSVPEAKLAAALKHGYHVETPEEAAQRADRGVIPAAAEAAAAGAFEGAVAPARIANRAVEALTGVNLGDKAVRAIDRATGGTGEGQSFDEATSGRKLLETGRGLVQNAGTDRNVEASFREAGEDIRNTALANPTTAMLGGAAGQIAGMGLSGGAGLLAKGAQLAKGALAARGAGSVLAGAGGLGAAGAAEGALQGAAQASEDAYIENKPLTAEQFWGTVGLNSAAGLLLGGGAGAALGKFEARAAAKTALGATKSAETEALEKLASRSLGGEPPAPGLGDAMREIATGSKSGRIGRAYEGTSAALSGVDREAIEKYGAHRVLAGDEEALGAWKDLRERPQIVEKAARDITEGVDALRRESDAITNEVWDAGLKREIVAKNLAGVDHQVALAGAREQAATIKQTLGALQDVETFGDNKWAKGALKFTDENLDDVLSGALGAEDSYLALDAAKRQLQRLKVRGEDGIRGATFDMNKKGALQEFTKLIDEAGENVRVHLEDTGLWGKQGEAQKAVNEVTSRFLTTKRVSDRALLTNYVDNYGRPVYEADPAKIEAFANGLGTARASKIEGFVNDNLTATRDLIDTIAANYDIGAKHGATLSAAREAHEKVANTLTQTAAKARRVNQITAMLEAEQGGVAGLIGNGTMTGGILGGIPGAALGAASNAVTRPMSAALQASKIMALAGNTAKRTTRALDSFFGHKALSDAGAVVGKAAGAAARALPAAGRRAAVAGATGQPAMAEGQKHRERVAELAANPVMLAEQVDKFLGGAAAHLPMTHMALAAVPMRAVQFLSSKLPPAPPPHALDGASKAPISQVDQDRFDEYVKGATDPLSTLEDLSSGMLTLERVEAMQAVYPEMYQELRGAVFDYVAAAGEADQPLAYNKRLQLDLLFGGKGAIEPTASVAYKMVIQQAATPPPKPPGRSSGGGGKAPNIAETYSNSLDRLSRR